MKQVHIKLDAKQIRRALNIAAVIGIVVAVLIWQLP